MKMNTQFHTPSFGDEEFDLTDVEPQPVIQETISSKSNEVNHQISLPTNIELPEPVKPVSAYALFFRDTVSAIKSKNPKTSFDEISTIVSSMWQVLEPAHKNVYNKKSDLAKREYIQKMAAYRNAQMREDPSPKSSDQHNTAHHPNISPKSSTLASRPVVFTIASRSGSNDSHSSMLADQKGTHGSMQNTMYSSNSNHQQQIVQIQSATPNQQPANLQLVSDAGSVPICLREHCNKRAIINPDWEDEYCSNECVVIHCRNVFNQWVKSNTEEQIM